MVAKNGIKNRGIKKVADAKKRFEAIERQMKLIDKGYYICGWSRTADDCEKNSGHKKPKIRNSALKQIGAHVHGHKPAELSDADKKFYQEYKDAKKVHDGYLKAHEAVR